MGARVFGSCLLLVALAWPCLGATDEAATGPVTITLTDGSRLVGTIVDEDEAGVTLRTASGLELKLPRETIADRTAARDSRSRWSFSDPNDSRLMFAPTGRPLGKGNGSFSDHYVLFPGFTYGLTNNLSLSGGVSTVPGLGLDEQLFYVSSTAAWRLSDKASVAVGGLYAAGTSEGWGAAVLFGVTTFGPSDRSLSLGLGFAAERTEEELYSPRYEYLGSRSDWRLRDAPILMVGGSVRLAKNVSLLSESWLFLGPEFRLSEQPFGLALRFFNGRLSADVGFVLVGEVLEEGFPVPWLSFAYHFGPARQGASRSTAALSGVGRSRSSRR